MSAADYMEMLADSARIAAFQRAIGAASLRDKVVLDLGTGLGTYAMFAAREGARVVAVDSDPVIELAEKLAAENGLADRITFLKGWSTKLEVPERADVLIFEDFSSQLADPDTESVLADARKRWLKPDARAIPGMVRLLVAPVTCPEAHKKLDPMDDGIAYGLDFNALVHRVLNESHQFILGESALLGEPREAGALELLSAEPLTVSLSESWSISRSAELHGLAAWIELVFADGSTYSNAPASLAPIWGQVLFPLIRPIALVEGDSIEVKLDTVGPDPTASTWWSWRVRAGDDEQDCNTFRAAPLSLDTLKRAGIRRESASCP